MTPKERDQVLLDLRDRMVRVETKLEDLPEMKKKLDSLMVKVAGTAATIAGLVALLSHFT